MLLNEIIQELWAFRNQICWTERNADTITSLYKYGTSSWSQLHGLSKKYEIERQQQWKRSLLYLLLLTETHKPIFTDDPKVSILMEQQRDDSEAEWRLTLSPITLFPGWWTIIRVGISMVAGSATILISHKNGATSFIYSSRESMYVVGSDWQHNSDRC